MSMREKCKKLWIRALDGEDIILTFSNLKDRERAKFTLYDATRKTSNEQLLRARELCEIRKEDGLALVIALKAKNPYHTQFAEQLDGLLNEGEKADPLEASLKRFQEKLEKEKGKEERPENPYFKREE